MLSIRSRREVERGRRTGGVAVAEADAPEPVDDDRRSSSVAQLAGLGEVPIRRLGECVDASVAEVADEEVAARLTEAGGCPGKSPRCVEVAAACDTPEQVPRRVVGIDVSQPVPVDLVVPVGVLLCVGDEDLTAEGLDSEWREACRKRGVLFAPVPA